MREIKFRGLRKVGKEMIVGDLARLMSDDNLCIMPKSFYGTRDFGEVYENGNPKIENYVAIGGFYPVLKETVGQYTGLKDFDGKEIFDGDVMCWKQNYGTKKQCNWVVNFNPEKGCKTWNSHPIDDAIVIGNIHENPELLNV